MLLKVDSNKFRIFLKTLFQNKLNPQQKEQQRMHFLIKTTLQHKNNQMLIKSRVSIQIIQSIYLVKMMNP